MTKWQWAVIIGLCRLIIALIEGEKFDSIEARVQYEEELGIVKTALYCHDEGEALPIE